MMPNKNAQVALSDAIDLWFQHAADTAKPIGYWRGTADFSDYLSKMEAGLGTNATSELHLPNCVVVIEYAKLAISENDEDAQKHLQDHCARLIYKLSGLTNTALARALSDEPGQNLLYTQSMLLLRDQKEFTPESMAQALCAIACAAVKFKQHDLLGCGRLIGLATAIYDRCWGIFRTRHFKGEEAASTPLGSIGPALNSDDDALQAMLIASRGGSFGSEGVTSSSWLTVYNALRYLLVQLDLFADDGRPPLKMLLADKDCEQGYVAHLTVQRADSRKSLSEVPFSGPFVDCRSFGITCPTPLSKKEKSSNPTKLSEGEMLLQSINLAWRCCRQSIQLSPSNALAMQRLGINLLPAFCGTLGGPSAGGLLAVGMIAAAEDRMLDPECTTTCSLSLTEEAIEKYRTRLADENQILHLEEIELRQVGYVPEKIDEAWKTKHALQTFLLHEKDIERWRIKHPRTGYPALKPVSTLANLWEAFRAADPLEKELERLAEHDQRVWIDARKDVANEKSLNPLVQHRLDCYVPPSFRVEGIDPQAAKSEQSEHGTALGSSMQQYLEAVIPSEQDDDDLLNLLALSLRATKWPDQPAWVKPNRNLVIYDNAGAGKTVCSLRLQYLLTDKGNWKRIFGCNTPPLVIHLDGHWPRLFDKDSRPLTLTEMLERQFAKRAGREREADRRHVTETVAYALRSKRVVLILDGWDQFSDSDRQHVAKLFHETLSDNSCKWIITSRVHAIESSRRDGLFDDDQWLRVRIDPFSEDQQDRYFNKEDATGKIIGPRWTQMVDRDAMKELLGLPMVLAMLRILIDESPENKSLPSFETLSQLYLVTSRKLLVTALKKNVEPIQKRLTEDEWRTFESLKEDEERLTLLERVLSLFAFQMMILQEYNARLYGEQQIKQFEEWCKKRYFFELNEARRRTDLEPHEKDELEEKSKEKRYLWKIAVEVLKAIELNHRSVTEAYGQTVLAFRSRKVMECLAARYLTCYATEHDVFGDRSHQCWNLDPETNQQDIPKLAAVDFVTDPEWAAMWELAISMPSRRFSNSAGGVFSGAVINHAVTCDCLSLLFEQPKPYQGEAIEHRALRPTHLLYQAWHLFEFDERLLLERRFNVDGRVITGQELLQTYGHDAFERYGRESMLGEYDCTTKKRLTTVCQQRLAVLEKFRKSSRTFVEKYQKEWNTSESAFIQLADPNDPRDQWDSGEFTMGAPDGEYRYDGSGENQVNPQHEVKLSPYRLHRYCITNAEYELFDPAHKAHREFGDKVDVTRHPVLNVSWYDAWSFSRWLGEVEIESAGSRMRYRVTLPSEAQWEYGCRCGSKEPFTWHDRQNGNRIESDNSNFDGNHAWPREEASQALKGGRTIPVDGRDNKLEVERNPWGLHQMHGNAYEWCLDWFDSDCYRNSPPQDPVGPMEGHYRVLRGGSWFSDGEDCRSGGRSRIEPASRILYYGFRLAAVLSSQAGG